jgi:hypothetical protein
MPKGYGLSSLHLLKISTPPTQTRKDDVSQNTRTAPKDFKKAYCPESRFRGRGHLFHGVLSMKAIVPATTVAQSDSQLW